ncbi:MAG: hypothetical protein ACYCO3_02910, partial [Mycobacteriales bacterium]
LKLFAAHGPAAAAAAAAAASQHALAGKQVATHAKLLRAAPRFAHHLLGVAGGKVAVIASVAAVSGFAAAGYAGALPASLQGFAHDVIGAPAPHSHPARPPAVRSAGRPGAGGPAGGAGRPLGVPSTTPSAGPSPRPVGTQLCVSWLAGGLSVHSHAYATLARDAGGSARISAYCAAALPGRAGHASGAATGHPGPSSHPSGHAATPAGASSHRSHTPAPAPSRSTPASARSSPRDSAAPVPSTHDQLPSPRPSH